jgi:hypothetical protein
VVAAGEKCAVSDGNAFRQSMARRPSTAAISGRHRSSHVGGRTAPSRRRPVNDLVEFRQYPPHAECGCCAPENFEEDSL